MVNLTYTVTKNVLGEIILTITYCYGVLQKTIEYTYSRSTLLNLLKHTDKEYFLYQQFKYIVDKIPYSECKDLFMIKRQQIKNEILILLNL